MASNKRCPDCKYGPDGTLMKWCIDCYDEMHESDDALYDVTLGKGRCEVSNCLWPTDGESEFCWIHMGAAMSGNLRIRRQPPQEL